MTAKDRVLEYAARMDALAVRFTYAGGRDPNTKAAAERATIKRDWYEKLAADLREVCGTDHHSTH